MVNPLAPANFGQVRRSSPVQNLLGGMQAGQQIQAQGFADERAPIEAQQRDSAFGAQQAQQQASVINRMAKHAKSLPQQEREAFRNSLPVSLFESLGVDLQMVAGFAMDDRSLDNLIAQTGALLPQNAQMNRVQSSQQLAGGLSVQTMADGSVRVVNAAGEQLTGAEAQKAVEEARQLGIDTEREKYGAREGGKLDVQLDKRPELEDAITRAKKNAENSTGQIKTYFEQLGNIQSNIANYNEAIRLIDEGAGTGAVESKLPSMRAASIKLDNVMGRLGLDVIGNTTFGALSEAELQFALDTALPTNLEGPELRSWLEEKRDAQQKLANYIDNAIQFLNIPGNSLADLQATNPRQTMRPDQSSDQRPAAGGDVQFLGFE